MLKNEYEKIDRLIRSLHSETNRDMSLDIAIEAANEFMRIVFPKSAKGEKWSDELLEGEDLLDETIPVSSFPNQKVESWFEKHPYLGGERVAMRHFHDDLAPIESKFYWLNKSSAKSRVAAGVSLTPNWEDSELTKFPSYKVGIDFFLTADGNSLLVAISNEGNLRVMELSERLSNTQIEILRNIDGAAGFDGIGNLEPQRTIHKTLWDAFSLKEVNKKFYEGVAEHFQILLQYLHDNAGKSQEEAKLFANRLIGRLLFIWFLRKKGFINEDMGYFDCKGIPAKEYYEECLKPLFFQTLNMPADERHAIGEKYDYFTPFLNGGLFDAKPGDWIDEMVDFPPDWFESLYAHFEEFNFTTDESTPEYEQVAIDPEMLGRVFENLLAAQLDETGKEARKASGSFYTPREIVAYMCKESLREYLYDVFGTEGSRSGVDRLLDMSDQDFEVKHSDAKKSLWGVERTVEMTNKAIHALDELKIVDPACGSGAFPMGMLQLLTKMYNRLGSGLNSYDMKLRILGNNIYGIDVQPMAVEISRLRAWLSLVVDESNPKNVRPLPNLDFKFVCANTLVPLVEDEPQMTLFDDFNNEALERLDSIMGQGYYTATDPQEKKRLREEYRYAVIALEEESSAQGSRRLKQRMGWNPFDSSQSSDFFDTKVMFNLSRGFDIAIGNPPYIQLQKMQTEMKKLYETLGYDTYESTGDIYALFYERGIELLRPNGILCYITSNKWMRAAYGESLRNFFLSKTSPITLIDFAGTKVFESATVDVNILITKKSNSAGFVASTIIRDDCRNNMSDYIRQHAVKNTFSKGESWVILSEIEKSIKKKIETAGVPLRNWDVKINRGVLTGCNEAFIIDGATKDRLIAEDSKSAELIRPILRGRDIKRYGYEFADQWLIATFPARHYEIENYPAIQAFLGGFRPKLEQTGLPLTNQERESVAKHAAKYHITMSSKDLIKARKKTSNRWFETQDTIAYWDDFSKQKIVWGNLCLQSQFALADEGYFINAPSPLITPGYTWLLAILNSRAADWYIRSLGVTRNGGYFEYKPMFVERLPLPDLTHAQKEQLSYYAALLIESEGNNTAVETAIDEIVFDIYGLNVNEREYLLR